MLTSYRLQLLTRMVTYGDKICSIPAFGTYVVHTEMKVNIVVPRHVNILFTDMLCHMV